MKRRSLIHIRTMSAHATARPWQGADLICAVLRRSGEPDKIRGVVPCRYMTGTARDCGRHGTCHKGWRPRSIASPSIHLNPNPMSLRSFSSSIVSIALLKVDGLCHVSPPRRRPSLPQPRPSRETGTISTVTLEEEEEVISQTPSDVAFPCRLARLSCVQLPRRSSVLSSTI